MKHLHIILGLILINTCLCANTLSGQWSKSYWQTGDVFETTNSYQRVHTYRIRFDESFLSLPRVAVSLYGFDLSYSNAGIRCEVGRIRKGSFDLRVIAPKNSYVYMAGVSWIATVDDNIQFKTLALPVGSTGSLGYGTGLRSERRMANLPNLWRRGGATVGISGFQFSGSGNGRLDVKVASVSRRYGAQIDFSCWADTTLNMAYATVIMYNSKADYTGSFLVQSSVTGSLYSGSGARSESKVGGADLDLLGNTGNVEAEAEAENVEARNGETQFLYGLSHIDFVYGKNYRLDQSFNLDDNGLTVVFKTWADTSIWQCSDNIFYALH